MIEYNKDLANELRKFIKADDFINKDYKHYETLFGNSVLCRVFRYDPHVVQTGLIGADGKPLVNDRNRRIIPIAKVIKKSTDCALEVNVGDLVVISDDLIGHQDNPAFIDFLVATNGEMSRGLEAVKPEAKIANYTLWRKQYGFVGNKVKELTDFDLDDYCTFLFPTNFIKGKLNIKTYDKWLSEIE